MYFVGSSDHLGHCSAWDVSIDSSNYLGFLDGAVGRTLKDTGIDPNTLPRYGGLPAAVSVKGSEQAVELGTKLWFGERSNSGPVKSGIDAMYEQRLSWFDGSPESTNFMAMAAFVYGIFKMSVNPKSDQAAVLHGGSVYSECEYYVCDLLKKLEKTEAEMETAIADIRFYFIKFHIEPIIFRVVSGAMVINDTTNRDPVNGAIAKIQLHADAPGTEIHPLQVVVAKLWPDVYRRVDKRFQAVWNQHGPDRDDLAWRAGKVKTALACAELYEEEYRTAVFQRNSKAVAQRSQEIVVRDIRDKMRPNRETKARFDLIAKVRRLEANDDAERKLKATELELQKLKAELEVAELKLRGAKRELDDAKRKMDDVELKLEEMSSDIESQIGWWLPRVDAHEDIPRYEHDIEFQNAIAHLRRRVGPVYRMNTELGGALAVLQCALYAAEFSGTIQDGAYSFHREPPAHYQTESAEAKKLRIAILKAVGNHLLVSKLTAHPVVSIDPIRQQMDDYVSHCRNFWGDRPLLPDEPQFYSDYLRWLCCACFPQLEPLLNPSTGTKSRGEARVGECPWKVIRVVKCGGLDNQQIVRGLCTTFCEWGHNKRLRNKGAYFIQLQAEKPAELGDGGFDAPLRIWVNGEYKQDDRYPWQTRVTEPKFAISCAENERLKEKYRGPVVAFGLLGVLTREHGGLVLMTEANEIPELPVAHVRFRKWEYDHGGESVHCSGLPEMLVYKPLDPNVSV
jgi:hypothetical protein